jgi:hypothetical protein
MPFLHLSFVLEQRAREEEQQVEPQQCDARCPQINYEGAKISVEARHASENHPSLADEERMPCAALVFPKLNGTFFRPCGHCCTWTTTHSEIHS